MIKELKNRETRANESALRRIDAFLLGLYSTSDYFTTPPSTPGFCLGELSCQACGKAPSKNGDILCLDCAHAYPILVELLRKHPELTKDDLTRLRDLFDWRNRKEQEWLENIFPKSANKAPFQTAK